MKIAVVGPAFPLRGGIAQYLAILHSRLVAAGHDVQFVSFTKQFPEWLFPGKTQKETSSEVIDVHPVPRFAPLDVRSWPATVRQLAAFDPEIVIFKWWMPFFGLGYWAVQRGLHRRTRTRVLYIIDNVIPHERRPGDRFLTKLAFSQTDLFIAQSRAVERDLFSWFPRLPRERVLFCPHPVYNCYPAFKGTASDARVAIGLPADAKVLLFFGFVRHYKGLDLLIRAMPHVRRAHPAAHLVVVGEFYEPRSEYDKLIRELSLQDWVTIRDDYCPNEEVGKYFAACDAVVLPYRSATQSGIIQVAYALDTPVITTNVGGLGEVVENGVTGFAVEPDDPQQIAQAVGRFYERGGRSAFVENVHRESRRYTWEALIEAIEKLAAV
jgi:glycosyltransferase involved in cell wall biosynthesis